MLTNKQLADEIDLIASGKYYSEGVLWQALEHPVVTHNDRVIIKCALHGRTYSHTDLYDIAIYIREYKA